MNKSKPQNCAEVCVCLLPWEPAWLGLCSYQGREFSHGKSINCAMLGAGAGMGSLPALAALLSSNGVARESFVSGAAPRGEFLLLPTWVATNLRWGKLKVAIELSHSF